MKFCLSLYSCEHLVTVLTGNVFLASYQVIYYIEDMISYHVTCLDLEKEKKLIVTHEWYTLFSAAQSKKYFILCNQIESFLAPLLQQLEYIVHVFPWQQLILL